MLHKPFYFRKKSFRERAQAIVEFAIVLPILMVLLVGIFEAARMIFIYSAVTTASREAVRFGSVIGKGDDGIIKYKNCTGIRNMAKRTAYFANLQDTDITITYDHGPGTAVFHTCTPNPITGVDPGYFISSGDRILVTVTAQYSPLTKLMPWGSRAFYSESVRTILGNKAIASNTAVPAGPPPGGGGPTDTPTATPTDTPTSTATETPTATLSGEYTPLPTLESSTPGPSETPSDTPTVTPSPTLTPTPTMVTNCSSVRAGAISISGNTMTMVIDNPNPYPLSVQDIYVIWNAATGADNGTLALQSVTLVDLFQTVPDSTGTKLFRPASTVTMPPTALSSIIFTFDQPYAHPDDNESIVINLSTLGCEGDPIRSP
jgi:Flp pilus assembly protein TadG